VRMRSLYLRPDALPGMPGDCTVLAMTPLVRSMIAEVTLLPRPPVPQSEVPRDLTLEMLLLHELPRLDAVPLAVPLPATPALRALCEGFVRQPVPRLRIEDWAEELGISRRSFTRRFRAETGLSLAEWRQRASVMAALPRLLAGVPVTEVALDLGYETPAAFGTMFRRVMGESPGRYGAG
ncbi:MAG: helix-turn-helix domain-containing protein, partial [Gluconacetobacter diazotrophicus]|nr:helix-turn-helix domain-containing protein [Gluconacetobacter diazotrophicus]